MDLQDKTILVTGASSGIGEATARYLAEKGTRVVVHYNTNENGAKSVLEYVLSVSRGVMAQADLMQEDEVVNMFALLKQQGLELDGVVNNAGRATSGLFDDLSVWEFQMQNILLSAVRVSKYFMQQGEQLPMRKIVNVTSLYGMFDTGEPTMMAYSAAKAAMNSMTKTLAKKVGPAILVNAVAPGWTWTPPWEGTTKQEKQELSDLTAIKRFIEPEEIAQVVATLLENDAITGEIILIDGGASIALGK